MCLSPLCVYWQLALPEIGSSEPVIIDGVPQTNSEIVTSVGVVNPTPTPREHIPPD